MSMKESVLFNIADHPTPKIDKGGVAYTLNSRDYKDAQCVMTYRKTAHPINSEQGQGYAETDVNDTLNIYDNSETRTPTLITQKVYDWHRQDTRMTELGDICVTAAAGWGGWWKQYAVCIGIKGGRYGNSSKKAYSYGMRKITRLSRPLDRHRRMDRQ